jgi:hypothetical protein
MHIKDNWQAYTSALKQRFIDEHETEKDERAMRALKYEGDMDDYVTQMEELNGRVGAHGATFRAIVRSALPEEVTKMIYSRAGGIPRDDEEFLAAVREAGRVVEEMRRDRALSKGKTLEVRENYQSKTKEAARPREAQQKDRKVRDKASEKKESSGKKDKKGKEKEPLYSSGKDALKGVPQAEIDKHKKDKADCWRCGRDGHKMYDCYAKKTTNGVELTEGASGPKKVASASKRKRNDDSDDESEKEAAKPKSKNKKAKTAAIRHVDDIDDVMSEAQARIWEIEDSDDLEEDFH